MYVKKISTGKAIPVTASSAVSTTVSLTADPQLFPFGQAGSSLIAFSLNKALFGPGSTSLLVAADGTNFTVANDVNGNAVTISFTGAEEAGTVKYFNVPNLGEAVKLKVKATDSTGAGTVDCSLIQN
jgi:hypothetical protein